MLGLFASRSTDHENSSYQHCGSLAAVPALQGIGQINQWMDSSWQHKFHNLPTPASSRVAARSNGQIITHVISIWNTNMWNERRKTTEIVEFRKTRHVESHFNVMAGKQSDPVWTRHSGPSLHTRVVEKHDQSRFRVGFLVRTCSISSA